MKTMKTNFEIAKSRRKELFELIAAAADEIASIDRSLPILYSQPWRQIFSRVKKTCWLNLLALHFEQISSGGFLENPRPYEADPDPHPPMSRWPPTGG
ncbi:MAG: hypothetical protein ACP5PV_12555 [Methanothrix sp.]